MTVRYAVDGVEQVLEEPVVYVTDVPERERVVHVPHHGWEPASGRFARQFLVAAMVIVIAMVLIAQFRTTAAKDRQQEPPKRVVEG